jgi:hypothetical protein
MALQRLGGRSLLTLLAICLFFFSFPPTAQAFCGFFVARADAKLYNSASHVVIAHDGNRSVFTMMNNFRGDVRDFARIVPIPVVPTREQIRIGDPTIVEQLEAFTAPRLVKYVDQPCRDEATLWLNGLFLAGIFALPIALFLLTRPMTRGKFIQLGIVLVILAVVWLFSLPAFLNQSNKASSGRADSALTVQVDDQFTVGEYDVTILSATESDGLVSWLRQAAYQVPDGAATVLQSYIQQGMKFFVVRVNLKEFQRQGHGFLRPIVIDYESPQFMLPIRLGTLNANGDQDLIIHVISRGQLTEVANYRTVPIPTDAKSSRKAPSGQELPNSIQNNFNTFYTDLFQQAYEQAGKNVAFLEYAGYTDQCDPCSVSPPDAEALIQAGVFWNPDYPLEQRNTVTRLHVRYNAQTFPEDLVFRQVDADRFKAKIQAAGLYFNNKAGTVFQGRYVIRHPKGAALCLSGIRYHQLMNPQRLRENLQRLTGKVKG